MKNKKMLGNILLLITAIIWGTAFVAQRVGMESIEPVTFTSSRMWLAALTAGTASLFLGRNKPETARKPGEKRQTFIGGICCGLFLTGASLFQQFGIVHTTAGKAGFITALYILLVPVVNLVLFKKRSSLHVWLAIAIGVAGMYLLCVTEDFRITHGDTLVCICALLFTGHILCCDHFSRLGDPVKISTIQFVVVALVSGVIALITETPSWAEIRAAAVPILWCGVMSGGVGYTLQMVAQGFTDPTVASLLMSLESVFAALTGALLLSERMSRRELLGCVIMFAAIILVQLPAPKKKTVE
ncbi:MAG: DMT family transporter [Oscillospiraceae bacterium]|nr:DMT family transporter [Oscillospiraceae bacterium]